jgi:tetratricopeptide (TPR) repeat protein
MQAMADRYTYLSLVGVFVAICWWLSDRLPKRPYFKVFGACSGVAVSCILLVLTNAQLKVWQSSLTLFTHAARVTDKNALASAQIGAELIRIGNTQEAYRIVSNALKDFPDDPDLLTQAGYALKEYEDPTDALNSFYRAIRSNPAASSAYLGLAELLSTHVNACYRNPKEAVRLAEEACLLVRTPGKAELKVVSRRRWRQRERLLK